MAVCILRTRCVVLVSAYDLRFVCYCVPRCQLVLCSFILFLSSLTWSRTAGSFLVYPVFVGSGPIFRLQILSFPSRRLFQSHVVRAYPRSSSETQGQIVGARERLSGRKKMVRRKVKNGAIFFHPFSLSLAPTICPWVSEDDPRSNLVASFGKLVTRSGPWLHSR